jgi:hypothetical protein
VYRGLTVSGNVLERDKHGDVYHLIVSDTTLGAVPVMFVLVPVQRNVPKVG